VFSKGRLNAGLSFLIDLVVSHMVEHTYPTICKGKIEMNANSNLRQDNSQSPTEENESPKDERASGRARVAQLLAQLIYKRWRKERLQNSEQKR
jgi:hypothetical protein